MRHPLILLFLPLAVLFTACASVPSPEERRHFSDMLAQQQGWQAQTISTGDFNLVTYLPTTPGQSNRLTVYIEGDGFSWVTPSLPSTDPTPLTPVGLQLALAHPKEEPAAYLARPCQYMDAQSSHCTPGFWTNQRFAPEVISASSKALDALKSYFKAKELVLAGYSGGGAVAALLAATRQDVVQLMTIAGNLDHHAWTTYHNISPLTGSLNPADYRDRLQGIPQWHFAGEKDQVVPPQIVQEFVSGLLSEESAQVIIVPGYDHACCWVENWRKLLGSRNTQRQ